jgi:REP element-mobilizing transposase RayT
MDEKFSQRKNLRLKEFDYSLNFYYFVTICMDERREFFSKITNEKSILTEYGKIVNEIWNNLPKYHPCEIDEFIIMPDHFHGIIILDNKSGASRKSLSTIIQRFKTFTTKKINELLDEEYKFHWQKSFYDRIIRNEVELYKIRKYIQLNPLNWELEKDLPENLDL